MPAFEAGRPLSVTKTTGRVVGGKAVPAVVVPGPAVAGRARRVVVAAAGTTTTGGTPIAIADAGPNALATDETPLLIVLVSGSLT